MYKKFRLATTIILILVAITIFFYVPVVWGDSGKPSASDYISDAILATPTPTPFPNAIGCIAQWSTAIQARIETADPQIRDGHWSCVRVVIAVPGPWLGGSVECGWTKEADGRIYAFTQSMVPGQNPTGEYWGPLQHPGETHTYLIKYKGIGTGRWKYYVDGIQIDTRFADFDVGGWNCSGGEVYSTANAMGVSGCLDNQYRDTSKVWHYYMYTDSHADYPYYIYPIPGRPYSWQVYGHNEP